MLDRALDLLAELAVRVIGLERCGAAVARVIYGDTGICEIRQRQQSSDEDEPESEAVGFLHD